MSSMTEPARASDVNWFHAGGALLSALGAVAHFILGVALVMPPVKAAPVDPEIRALMDVVWLHTGLALSGAALLLGIAALRPVWRRPAGWIVGAYYALGTAIIVATTLAWFGSLLPLPQWIPFALISLLAFLGLRRS